MREEWTEWPGYEVLGNPVVAWAAAGGVLVVAMVVLSLLRRLVVRRAGRMGGDGRPGSVAGVLLRVASSLSRLVVLALALRVAALTLSLDGRAEQALRWVVVLALAWQAAVWAGIVVESLLDVVVARRLAHEGEDAEPVVASMGIFRFLVKAIVYAVVALVAVDNLGTDVTALVAGLGVGGIAIALAVQNIVSDLFGSMSITLDKPFVVGDFIVVGDKMGTVESVGIKTTRVRALSGEQLVFGNTDLLSSRIQNFKRMRERRVVLGLGVTYQTPVGKLEAIPGILREIVEDQERARFDRSHFKGFGAFSLDFETVYYVGSPEYEVYMDVQQAIDLEVCRRFEEQGIEFAYPTRTLFLVRAEAEGS